MEKELEGRVALVTGGSRGIGKEIALLLTIKGATVIICGRDAKNLADARWEIIKLMPGLADNNYAKVIAFEADVTQPAQINRLFSSLIQNKFGRLDILVNNVGGAEKFGNFFDLTDEDWFNAFGLNLVSMVRFCRRAIPWLKQSSNPRIVNISSLVTRQPGRFNPHYGAAKAGINYLNKYLANELAKDNILVNAICPGILRGGGWDTNVADRAQHDGIPREEAEKTMINEAKIKIPLRKLGRLEDVAELVVFLASDRAKFITGQVIDVDGGMRRSVH